MTNFIKIVYLPGCSIRNIFYVLILIYLCIVFHMWIMEYLITFADNIATILSFTNRICKTKSEDFKYILVWDGYYLIATDNENNIYSKLNCSAKNCVITSNKYLLDGGYRYFDAIIFNEKHLNSILRANFTRLASQLYIFTTIESSFNQPACKLYNDNFFNWTFTYRLDSDVVWNYFFVRNSVGTIVAPSTRVQWNVSLDPVREEVKSILENKTKAAAWLVSHCSADSLRDDYMSMLQEHLYHFSLKIDVYGLCSHNKCDGDDCEEMVKRDYYFYMAFENSFAEDYVTEKVMHGYNNYAIPIVYGGANYTRFLPPGSYLNAREMHPYSLAFRMQQIIKNPALLESYFKWTNLYTIDIESETQHPLCDLCAALNSEKAKNAPAKTNFRLWWNGLNGMKWCLSEEYWNETANVNIDGRHIFQLY